MGVLTVHDIPPFGYIRYLAHISLPLNDFAIMPRTVLLTGFSTAGKSTLLKQLKTEVNTIDSDEQVARVLGCDHIYDVFMEHGPKYAIELIEKAENEFLKSFSNQNEESIIIAAGPFLMLRDEWDAFYKARSPFIVHLVIREDDVYEGLLRRRNDQKKQLLQSNPHFGSWDNDVTTTLSEGIFVDLPKDKALENIRTHLKGVTAKYLQFEDVQFDSMTLRNNDGLRDEATQLIKSKLGI